MKPSWEAMGYFDSLFYVENVCKPNYFCQYFIKTDLCRYDDVDVEGDANSCNSYFCRPNGLIFHECCASGYYFDDALQDCVSNNGQCEEDCVPGDPPAPPPTYPPPPEGKLIL